MGLLECLSSQRPPTATSKNSLVSMGRWPYALSVSGATRARIGRSGKLYLLESRYRLAETQSVARLGRGQQLPLESRGADGPLGLGSVRAPERRQQQKSEPQKRRHPLTAATPRQLPPIEASP